MIWGIWGERAGAPSTVNRRRISTHGYCGKQCADIIANSVTLCEISSCGYFCGNFAGIGDISDILTVWYFDRSPVNCPGVSWCGLGPPLFFFFFFCLCLYYFYYFYCFCTTTSCSPIVSYCPCLSHSTEMSHLLSLTLYVHCTVFQLTSDVVTPSVTSEVCYLFLLVIRHT